MQKFSTNDSLEKNGRTRNCRVYGAIAIDHENVVTEIRLVTK